MRVVVLAELPVWVENFKRTLRDEGRAEEAARHLLAVLRGRNIQPQPATSAASAARHGARWMYMGLPG